MFHGAGRWCRGLVLFVALVPTACALRGGTTFDRWVPVATDTLAPGVVHIRYAGAGPAVNAHVVAVDLRRPELRVESALAGGTISGRELTTAMVHRHNRLDDSVVVAINADFFDVQTGEVENNQVIGGSIVRATSMTDSPHDTFDNIHTQVAFTVDGRPLLERFRFAGKAILGDGATVSVDRVNATSDSGAVILYTDVHDLPAPTLPDAARFRLDRLASRGDTTFYRVPGDAADDVTPIRAGTAILAAAAPVAATLRRSLSPGDTVRIVLEFQPDHGPIRTLVGGWPRLLRHGENIATHADDLEGTFPRFSRERHPRTAVGFSRDSTTLYLVTVDGRQDSSIGMTLEELADFLLVVGAYDALNLDGGGSTTLVVAGDVVNSPSDAAGERPVGNVLLVIRRVR